MRTPTFPHPKTLTARALIRLLRGQNFTHREFQHETASYRLSSSIEQLRNRHGWIIETSMETKLTRDPVARKATYSRYYIEKKFLRRAKSELGDERITNFIEAVQRFEAGGV